MLVRGTMLPGRLSAGATQCEAPGVADVLFPRVPHGSCQKQHLRRLLILRKRYKPSHDVINTQLTTRERHRGNYYSSRPHFRRLETYFYSSFSHTSPHCFVTIGPPPAKAQKAASKGWTRVSGLAAIFPIPSRMADCIAETFGYVPDMQVKHGPIMTRCKRRTWHNTWEKLVFPNLRSSGYIPVNELLSIHEMP